MRPTLLTLSIMLGITAFSQDFHLSVPIQVAPGYGYNHPQIEVATDGRPLILWTGTSDNNLYIARHNGIDGFDTPVQLNPSGLDVQNYNWSGADLTIEGTNVYVTFRSAGYETGHNYLVKSTDNGITFGDTVRIDNLSSGFGQYPDIVVYQDTLWATFMKHDAGGVNPQYVVTRSTDGGLSFEPEVDAGIILGAEACDCCQPEIIVNDQLVILFFRNNDSNERDIRAIVSYDRGATFSDWIAVDQNGWMISACPSVGPDARFMSGNSFALAYKTKVGTENRVVYTEYDVNSASFIGQFNVQADVSDNNLLVNYPQIAHEGGVLGIVWEGKGNGIDVFINSSSTGIAGLNSATAINISDTSGSQSKPDIAIRDGLFHVVYTDYSQSCLQYVTLDRFTGIEDHVDLEAISILTNSTEQFIQIQSENSISDLRIFAINGQLVFHSTNYLVGNKINTNNWNKGIYIISIKVRNEVLNRKIVI